MPKGTTFASELLSLVFSNTGIALVGDATGLRGSSAAGSLYVSLHTADPTAAGAQNSSEAGYTGYARVAVSRAGGFTVTGASVSPAANVDFGECTASPGGALTHWAIGTSASGAGKILYVGTLTPNITVAVGAIPRVKTTSTVTES